MSSVSINGITYKGGKNVSVINGRVIIDGKDVTADTKDAREINISIEGNVGNLTVDECINLNINGSCDSVSTVSGDVNCGPVNKSVKTVSGDVKCGDVGGDVETVSGDVDCGAIAGNAQTQSGDIDRI